MLVWEINQFKVVVIYYIENKQADLLVTSGGKKEKLVWEKNLPSWISSNR
jgi:hypothetical protein